MKLEQVYKKRDVIDRLNLYVIGEGKGIEDEYGHDDYIGSRTDRVIARALALWLEFNTPDDPHQNYCAYFHKWIPDAFDDFRTLPKYELLRKEYNEAMGGHGDGIPDLLTPNTWGQLEGHSVARLLAVFTGQAWLRESLEGDFNAEMTVISHAWRAFVRKAYKPLIKRINAESHRGNIGKFGATTLMTYAMAGRVMFTFQRGDDNASYVADDGDELGHRSGANFPHCDFVVAVEMIRDVTKHWDMSKLKRSDKVGM